jgi:hypothetical protein
MKLSVLAAITVLSVSPGSELPAQAQPLPNGRFWLPRDWNPQLEHRLQLGFPNDSSRRIVSLLFAANSVTFCPMPVAPVDTTVDRRMPVAVSDSLSPPVRMPVAKGWCENPLGPKRKDPH